MDFRTAVIESLDRLIASGAIEKAIEATLAKTIATVLEHELRSYSDFGKQIEEAVKQSLAIRGDLDLPAYNDTLLQILRRQVETQTNAVLEQQVVSRMKELLTPAPESITLTKLVEAFMEQVKDHTDSGCVCYGEGEYGVSVDVTQDGYFGHIRLADEPDAKKWDIDIGFSNREQTIYSLRLGAETEGRIFAGPFYNFERLLFQMKAAGTKIVIDCDPADLETTFEPEYAH